MKIPQTGIKLRHVSLFVQSVNRSVEFYNGVLGMVVYYQPNEENVYLTTGDDVIALHQAKALKPFGPPQAMGLDHLGFFVASSQEVWDWYLYLTGVGVRCLHPTKHGDNSEGFYVYDPDGNSIEIISVPKTLIP